MLAASDRAWRSLVTELDAWAVAGLTATFWWRDDDATESSPALRQLRSVAEGAGVPITLSVIPAAARSGLVGLVDDWAGVTPVQHGFNHANHATAGSGNAEFTDNRPLCDMAADIETGDRIMKTLFGDRALPVFVPPWNRMPAILITTLAELGFVGLSSHSARDLMVSRTLCRLRVRTAVSRAVVSLSGNFHRCRPTVPTPERLVPELRAVTTVGATIDVIDWRLNHFLGEGLVLDHIVRHLRMRRLGYLQVARPTGLLTHHGVMNEDAWGFVERFTHAVGSHPAVRWLTTGQVFDVPAERSRRGQGYFASSRPSVPRVLPLCPGALSPCRCKPAA